MYAEGSSGVWATNTLHSCAFSHLFSHGVPIFSDGTACVWRCCFPPWLCERPLNHRKRTTISNQYLQDKLVFFLTTRRS
jgi:hypothetical protein